MGILQQATAQKVALRNNLLYDATLTPNLGIEAALGRQWSLGLNAGYRPWPTSDETTRKYRHLLLSPQLRFYTDSVFHHHFFGLHAVYSHYNVADVKFPLGLYKSVRDHRRQGDLAALGLSYGYNWRLSGRWSMEAELGAALGYTNYREYACGHCGKRLGKDNELFLLPKLALNIVYNIGPRPQAVMPVVPVVPVDTVVRVPVVPVPVVEPVVPVVPKEKTVDSLRRIYPVLAHISEYRPYDRGRALRRDSGALFVYFQTAKNVLDMDYHNNRQTLDRIVSVTRQMMKGKGSHICKIQIVGLASIDGPVPVNERLSQERANILKDYIQQQVGVPDSLFELSYGGEAWAELRDQLTEAGMQEALDVFYSEPDLNRREQKLRRLNGGRVWQKMKEQILVDQRNAGYMKVYFDYDDDQE